METENGTDPNVVDTSTEVPEAVAGPGPDSEAGETPAQQPTGINPAWAPIRDVLGDDIFDVNVAPHLQKFDEAAQSRITNLTSQLKGYEGYTPFVEQGVNPSDIEMAMQLRQLVETDPQAFYSFLGQHLGVEQEDVQEGLEEFGAGQENGGEVPPHIQAQLDQLTQFQEQVLSQQQQEQQYQQEQQAIEVEGQRLDQEMTSFITSNPSFSDADKAELYRAQYEITKQLEAKGLNRMATLDEAAALVNERAAYYRQRGGGGAGAPNTLPTTTGGDIPGQQPDVGKMSKQDFSALIANDLFAAKAQS